MLVAVLIGGYGALCLLCLLAAVAFGRAAAAGDRQTGSGLAAGGQVAGSPWSGRAVHATGAKAGGGARASRQPVGRHKRRRRGLGASTT